MISIAPYCRSERAKKNGKAPIIIYIKKTGESRKAFNSGLEVAPQHFDNKTKKFKKGSGDTLKLQTLLDNILFKLRAYAVERPHASPDDIIAYYRAGSSSTFNAFARQELFMDRKQLSFKAHEQYQYCLDLLEKHWGSAIGFGDLTPDNIRMYEYRMSTHGLGHNTQRHALKTLKKYTRRALQKGMLRDNPFHHYKVGNYRNAEREWTTEEEIDRLKDLWATRHTIPKRLHSTLIHYLHACHTGLRAIDCRRFRTQEHAVGDFISIIPSKSKELTLTKLRIPINDYAAQLHAEIDQYPLKVNASKITDNLKEICTLAGIAKHITFHCARHSFAINSLIKKVPIEVVSKWLGHTTITTTQIYAKVVDALSGDEMEKWNTYHDYTIRLSDIGLQGQFQSREKAIAYLQKHLE